jgi:hypothetical protein
MYNIVKSRDFMLASDVKTKQEAERIARDYGAEFVVVLRDPDGIVDAVIDCGGLAAKNYR